MKTIRERLKLESSSYDEQDLMIDFAIWCAKTLGLRFETSYTETARLQLTEDQIEAAWARWILEKE